MKSYLTNFMFIQLINSIFEFYHMRNTHFIVQDKNCINKSSIQHTTSSNMNTFLNKELYLSYRCTIKNNVSLSDVI